MARTTEFTLGLIGGLIGLLAALAVLFMGGVVSILDGGKEIANAGIYGLVASIIGIVGAAYVKSDNKIGGVIMLVAAAVGLWYIGLFYIISGPLLGIAGILALVRKDKK